MTIIYEKLSLFILFAVSIIILTAVLSVRIVFFNDVAENLLRELGADSVTVGEASVNPFGVRIKNVDVYKRISDDKDYRVSVYRADVGCNILLMGVMFLFSRDKIISDRDIFRDVYEKPFDLAGDVSAFAASIRPLEKISLRGANVLFSENGKTLVSADGISADIVNDRSSLNGSVSVKTAFVPSLAEVEDFNVKLRMSKERLDLIGGNGFVFGGKIGADVSLDPVGARIISGNVIVKGLDLEKYCIGTNFAPGILGGKADMEMQAESGASASLDSIRASGSFKVTDLTAVEIALQRTQAVNQLSKELRTLLFNEVTGSFRMSGTRINFGEIVGTGDVMKFRSMGWADFTGRLSQDLEGELHPKFVSNLPRVVRNSLERTDEGGGKFKCRITGTFHRPRVEIDRSVYNRAFRNLFR